MHQRLNGLQCIGLIGFIFFSLVSTAFAETPRLLFIGNSYTYGNDLEQMTAKLMAKASSDWEAVEADRHALGGARFVQHLAEADGTNGETNLRTKILGPAYFAVMLQEQSQIPGFPQANPTYQESSSSFAGLNQLVQSNGAHTLALMTWARRSGDSQNALRFPDFKVMQSHLRDGYFQYATSQTTDNRLVVVVPAGLAFEKVYDDIVAAGEDPLDEASLFWNLYVGDGSHPSLAGSYLTACTLFGSLTGQRLDSLEWAPEGIDDASRDAIQAAANFAVFDSHVAEDAPALFLRPPQTQEEPDSEEGSEPEEETDTETEVEDEVSPEPVSPAEPEPAASGGCSGCNASQGLSFYLLIPALWLFRQRSIVGGLRLER